MLLYMRRSHVVRSRSARCITSRRQEAVITATNSSEKGFVGWPHACETWTVVMGLRYLHYSSRWLTRTI